MAYADACNAEMRDLFAAGAECAARRALHAGATGAAVPYGFAALNRALEGIKGTTAVHICFGYAAIIHERPAGYSFCPNSPIAPASDLDRDRAVESRSWSPHELPDKTIILGVIDLSERPWRPTRLWRAG